MASCLEGTWVVDFGNGVREAFPSKDSALKAAEEAARREGRGFVAMLGEQSPKGLDRP
jgi:hypothetical protein